MTDQSHYSRIGQAVKRNGGTGNKDIAAPDRKSKTSLILHQSCIDLTLQKLTDIWTKPIGLRREEECKEDTDWNFTYNLDVVTQSEIQVPKPGKGDRISMLTIRALANHIAEKFDPDEIILFGSHAYGRLDSSSDVDLLVVMETPKGEVKTIMEISDSLPPLPFHVDIIARSRATINKRKNSGDFFLREVTKRGKVLYARGH